MFIKEETKKLGNIIIDNYDKLIHKTHTVEIKNCSIWIANGFLFIDFYPNIHAFNIFEKIYLHRCIKKALSKKITQNAEEKINDLERHLIE